MTNKQTDTKVAHKKTLFSAKNRQLSAAMPKVAAICAGCVTSLGTILAIVKKRLEPNAERRKNSTSHEYQGICLRHFLPKIGIRLKTAEIKYFL